MHDTSTLSIRTTIQPGDLGYITYLHGKLYAEEYGFDATFEAYVAGPFAEFVKHFNPEKDRLWVAEMNGEIVGSVAIVGQPDNTAQLRWYLVHPSARGNGLGTKLLHEAVQFCHDCGYKSTFLWTVSQLHTAAYLYRSVGFRVTEEKTHPLWGQTMTEQRYDLVF